MRTYRAELLRSASRATGCLLLLCLCLAVFSMSNAGPQHEPPLWGFRQAAIFIATLLMGRAATVTAGDFSTGTIRPWIISTRSRGPVFLGKLAASLTIEVGTAVLMGLGAYLVSGVFGRVPPVGAMATATAQLALACAALSVFGHATGVMTRSVPVALTVTLGWILPAEAVLQGRSARLDRWLPGSVLHDFTLGHVAPGGTTAEAVFHATLPLVLLDAAALVFFLRRDINS
ncbi:hypothetical protein [Actinoallomurus sp. CA-142502]|uniref:hypothetical protein n=1 Tax=Actinoallomurus sp. CA-142502 TaxID=3239885 RepID=UPI003D8B30D2